MQPLLFEPFVCVVGSGSRGGRQAAEGLVPSREPSGAQGVRALGQKLETTRSLRDCGPPTAPRLLFPHRFFLQSTCNTLPRDPHDLWNWASETPCRLLCYVTARRRSAVCKCLDSDLVWLQRHRCEDKWLRGLECLSLKDVSLCWTKFQSIFSWMLARIHEQPLLQC